MKSLQEKIEMLEKQISKLKEKVEVEQKQVINSHKDALNLLNPVWYIDSTGTIDKEDVPLLIKSDCSMTTEKQAKRVKAFIKLHLIAEAMNKDVECNRRKYIIEPYGTRVISLSIRGRRENEANMSIYPLFNSRGIASEARRKFDKLFRDLYMMD